MGSFRAKLVAGLVMSGDDAMFVIRKCVGMLESGQVATLIAELQAILAKLAPVAAIVDPQAAGTISTAESIASTAEVVATDLEAPKAATTTTK